MSTFRLIRSAVRIRSSPCIVTPVSRPCNKEREPLIKDLHSCFLQEFSEDFISLDVFCLTTLPSTRSLSFFIEGGREFERNSEEGLYLLLYWSQMSKRETQYVTRVTGTEMSSSVESSRTLLRKKVLFIH